MNKNNMLMQMPEITGIRMFSAGPDENDSGMERTIVRIPDMASSNSFRVYDKKKRG
jgi:hypothetical protein